MVSQKRPIETKLLELLQSDQFKTMTNTDDSTVLKSEKDTNKELLSLEKGNDIYEQIEFNRYSNGLFVGLEKVLGKDIPLRPVLHSISSWKIILHLEQIIGKIFDKIEGANMERNTQPAREIFENAELDSDENIISLDVEFCTLILQALL